MNNRNITPEPWRKLAYFDSAEFKNHGFHLPGQGFVSPTDMTAGSYGERLLSERLLETGQTPQRWFIDFYEATGIEKIPRVMVFFPRPITARYAFSLTPRQAAKKVAFLPFIISCPYSAPAVMIPTSVEALRKLSKYMWWLAPVAEALESIHPLASFSYFPDDSPSFPGFDAAHGHLPELNEHYGLWTVMGEGDGYGEERQTICICRGCKEVHSVFANELINGSSRACEKCQQRIDKQSQNGGGEGK